ncbi:hypothetical protein D3C72_2475100 [compost metagenome]
MPSLAAARFNSGITAAVNTAEAPSISHTKACRSRKRWRRTTQSTWIKNSSATPIDIA